MAFTSKLGTVDSRLGNIQLGIGGDPSGNYQDSLTLAAIADLRLNQLHILDITVAGNSAATQLDGFRYQETLTVDGSSATAQLDGFRYQETLDLDGVSDLGVFATEILTLDIDGIADAAVANTIDMVPTLGVSGIAAVTLDPQYNLAQFLTVAGLAAFFSPGGLVLLNNLAIEGFSDITRLAGFGFFETVDVDGVSDLTLLDEVIKFLDLEIDGVADAAVDSLQNGNLTLTVGGFAALTIDASFSYQLILSLAGISTIYQGSDLNGTGDDGLYNFLAITVNETTSQATERHTPGNQNPSAQGGVTAECTGVFNRTITQSLTFTQLAAIKKPTEIIDTFLITSQVAFVQRVRNRSITQTFTMTQEAEWFRAFAQSLNFMQQATAQKVISRTVSQTLAMTQQANRATVLSRMVTDTLTMGQNRLVRAPLTGSINTSNITPFEYYRPVAQAILVPVRCLVILGVPTQTVILPCPQFGDTQALQSTLNLKRTMVGHTYTYVRKTELQKLKYTFHLGTLKAIELQSFLENHCHEIITLVNHKGETWYVNIVNNPFDFTVSERWQPKGERHDITLEFEGVRL